MNNLEEIKSKIYTIREKQVMLDSDIAQLYQVETKVFNQAIKRNIKRFPKHFMFQLTKEEFDFILRSQIVTLNKKINNERGRHRKYLPFVFTEQGVSMLSAVLKSEIAIETSIKIIDAFVNMRKFLLQNSYIYERLDNLELKYLNHDNKINQIFDQLSNNFEQKQGIFFNGQIFDAHIFISNLIRKAKNNIILIDNYINEQTLNIFSKTKITTTIYTKTITKELKQDIEKYNKQYNNIELKEFKHSHDRFLIIDDDIYHIGASLKDLGKKIFAFSKLEMDKNLILDKLI